MFRLRRRPKTGRVPAARRRATARFELGAVRLAEPRRGVGRMLRRVAVTGLVLSVIGGAIYGASWLLLGDALRVRDVTVVGAQIADPFAVSAAAALSGESLLTLDAGAAAARVAALPGVKTATVHRDWPRGVIIDVTEHRGWGYWQTAGVRQVIDADGGVLERARPPADDAPTIFEIGPPPADGSTLMAPDADTVRLVERLLVSGAFGLLRVEPSSFVFRRETGLTVLIEGGPHVLFGDSHNFDFKIAGWGALLDRIDEQQLEVSEIDLRFGNHLVMR